MAKQRVAVVRFSALGDVAMVIPVLYAACACHPETQFVMVTRASMTGIFVNKPDNLQLLGIDLKEQYAGLKGMLRLARQLRTQYNVDAIVDLHDVLRTKVLRTALRMHGVHVSVINKGRSHKRALTRPKNKVMLPLPTQRDRYRAVFHKAGLPLEWTFEGLYGKGGHAPVADFAAITGAKADGEKWVGIAPFSAHRGKTYPLAKMQEFVELLISRHPGARIFLFGGPGDEAKILDAWAQTYPNVQSLAGKKYGFQAELALLSHLDVMLAMDSANMHLAAICGTPVVSLWGATHPYCGFKAWRQTDTDTVQLAMTCRPCSVFGNKPCHRGDYYCLNGIAPSLILEKLDKYIC